jgi:hypothetical protein
MNTAMTDNVKERPTCRITRSADVDAVVAVADLYADEASRLHEFVTGEELRRAMAGAFLMFLADVAQSEA